MNGSVGQYPFGLGIFGGGFAITAFPTSFEAFVGEFIDIPISVTWVRGLITFKLYVNDKLINTDVVQCTTPYNHTYTYTHQVGRDDNSLYYEITNQYVTIRSQNCLVTSKLSDLTITPTALSLVHKQPVISKQLIDIFIPTKSILWLQSTTPIMLENPKIEVVINSDRDRVSNGSNVIYTASIIQNFGNTHITPLVYIWTLTDTHGNVISIESTDDETFEFKFINSESIGYVNGELYGATVRVSIDDGLDEYSIESSNIAFVTFDEVRALIRGRTNRMINIEQYLPEQYFDTDVHDLVKAYQSTLNNLYSDGNGTMRLVMDELDRTTLWVPNDSGVDEPIMNPIITHTDTTNMGIEDLTDSVRGRFIYEPSSTNKISILEKITRMSDLRDPYMVDSEYLSAFASDLGYNIDMGFNYADTYSSGGINAQDPRSRNDIMMNVRHVIKSLPYWYKIKSTKNAFKILLYSYGLIGDIINYYSNDYKNFINESDALSEFNKHEGYYPTSHIGIKVYAEDTTQSIENQTTILHKRLGEIINVIENIKPITTVIHAISIAYEKIMIGEDAINMNMSVTVRQIRRT